MHKAVSRYEFRIFARRLKPIWKRLQALTSCESISDSVDTYLLNCDKGPFNNIKIRNDRLELKKLREQYQGLERWEPAGQWSFPLSLNTIQNLWTDVVLERKLTGSANLSCNELIHLAEENSRIRYVNVHKRRYRFALKGCDAEMDRLLIEGHTLESCAVESSDPQSVLEVLNDLGLSEDINCSYPRLLCQSMELQRLTERTHGG
jgi:hypothetical protein